MHIGIIPAYAGCTDDQLQRRVAHRDHPRIRGVHFSAAARMNDSTGSSPHTRGARQVMVSCPLSLRIIPAYAGCTFPGGGAYGARADHPRIRGVHTTILPSSSWVTGSSPHTRGAPWDPDYDAFMARIIPAYAGCTDYGPECPSATGDHPRIRGVHMTSRFLRLDSTGSSPHTRGAPHRISRWGHAHRIIPAYAGCTWSRASAPSRPSDHPRIRGVHVGRLVVGRR